MKRKEREEIVVDKIEYQEICDLLEELNLKDHYTEITKNLETWKN